MKGILIKSAIALAVLTLIHSIFWFFKAGQIEKQVNHFVSENATYISVGKVAVSGFPLSQKVSVEDLRFVIPNSALTNYQTTVKQLEAKTSIFSSDFTVLVTDQVLVQNLETTESGYVEFSSNPIIKISLVDGVIANFTYKDSGYRILDADKIVIYQASSSDISFTSTKEDEKTKNRLKANVKDIEGFDVISVYKNAVERKIINGIKTGEISIGNAAADLVTGNAVVELTSDAASIDEYDVAAQGDLNKIPADNATDISLATDVPQNPVTETKTSSAVNKSTDAVPNAKMAMEAPTIKEKVKTNTADVTGANTAVEPVQDTALVENDTVIAKDAVKDSSGTKNETPNVGNTLTQTQDIIDQNNDQATNQNPTIVANNSDAMALEKEAPAETIAVKSNLDIDIEYELVPSELDKQSQSPIDITQIQDSPIHYSKIMKVNNFEFSNSLYKITLNGQMSIFQDDVMPSGALTAKVEQIGNLISFISNALSSEITVQAKETAPDLQTAELPIYDNQLDVIEPLAQSPNDGDHYQDFLKRLTANLAPIIQELSHKNQLTTDTSAVFDIRREKNLEILVNETPVREILGKI
jgi:hypothetical protein